MQFLIKAEKRLVWRLADTTDILMSVHQHVQSLHLQPSFGRLFHILGIEAPDKFLYGVMLGPEGL